MLLCWNAGTQISILNTLLHVSPNTACLLDHSPVLMAAAGLQQVVHVSRGFCIYVRRSKKG